MLDIRLTIEDGAVRMNLVTDRLEVDGSRADSVSLFTGRPGTDTRLWLDGYTRFYLATESVD